MPKLSIIILSYNTAELTEKCIRTLALSLKLYSHFQTELILVDNASHDESPQKLQTLKSELSTDKLKISVILNAENEGYPKGNNRAVKASNGRYILFLNSDVIIEQVAWNELLDYMDKSPSVGVLTVKVNLPTKSIDPASHRGFPTVWNALSYYSGLEKLTKSFPLVKNIFGGYHLTYKSLDSIHEIDSPSGAFFLTRKAILDEIGAFDETFFMYGEDLDLSYRIKEKGYTVIYYPLYTVTHLKYQSGLGTKKTETKKKTRSYFYEAMKIFYRKHYESQYPSWVNRLVFLGIDFKSKSGG